jgi:hypothetical protein
LTVCGKYTCGPFGWLSSTIFGTDKEKRFLKTKQNKTNMLQVIPSLMLNWKHQQPFSNNNMNNETREQRLAPILSTSISSSSIYSFCFF